MEKAPPVETATRKSETEAVVTKEQEEEVAAAAQVAIDGADLFTDHAAVFTLSENLLQARIAVNKCRKICRFMKNSTLSKGKLADLQQDMQKVYEFVRLIESDNIVTSNDVEIGDVGNVDAMLDCIQYYVKHGEEGKMKQEKKLILDVRTQWNSAFSMIQHFVT
jgi:hypothetical protein